MLSNQYNPELTPAQNYFGDSFDPEVFVDQYAEKYAEAYADDPDGWNNAFTGAVKVAEKSLAWITDELHDKAGKNLGRIDKELRSLERRGERSLRPGAISHFLKKSAGGEDRVTEADIEVTCIAVEHGVAVLRGLMLYRAVEDSLKGVNTNF